MTHLPVLLDAVRAAIPLREGTICVDATFGGGGYSRAFLEQPGVRVIGVDRDPAAVARGRALEAENPGFRMVQGNFAELGELVRGLGIDLVDAVVFDLGVSSYQLDEPTRGFSFGKDGPLDMRMSADGPTAADLVNRLDEGELARLLRRFGEEPAAARIARAIVRRRARCPITRTGELAAVVEQAVGRGRGRRHHPATRTFQALRIAVNDELGALERGLEAALALLVPGGSIAVVSFHSLEDRIVKRFFARHSGALEQRSRHLPPLPPSSRLLELPVPRMIRPGRQETARNPRARSARLRVARRRAGRGEETGEPDRRRAA